MRVRLPMLPALCVACLLSAVAVPVHAQYTVGIGATIVESAGDEGLAPLEVRVGSGGLELRAGAQTSHAAIQRSTHVARMAVGPAAAVAAPVVRQRTDVVADAAVVQQAVQERGAGGVVRLVHTTVLVVDA